MLRPMSGADTASHPAVQALAHMSPRRFELLLVALTLPQTFTAATLREQLTDGQDTASLLRDLRALEIGGWLLANPSVNEARQGRTVRYRIAPLAVTAWRQLAHLVEEAQAAAFDPVSDAVHG
jgi:hypothetical protein